MCTSPIDELRVYWFEIFECGRKIALVWCVSPLSRTSQPRFACETTRSRRRTCVLAACLSFSRGARLDS